MKKNIRADIGAKKNDKIVVFGIGNYAKIFCDYYGNDVIENEIDLFVVSKKNRDVFYGKMVVELDSMDVTDEYICIVALSKQIRLEVEGKITKKFKRIVLLEEFMLMSSFITNDKVDREKEVQEYWKFFQTNKPMFQWIEIETLNRCNGECGFCPVNRNEKQRPYKKMSRDVFVKIVDELSELNYRGNVAMFSNNEPFLDDRIETFCKYAREKLPEAYIYIASNGTLLDVEKVKKIIEYVDELVLDIYKNDLCEKDPDNVMQIINWSKQEKIDNKIRIGRINKKAIRSSRGGSSPNSKSFVTIQDSCPLLLLQMIIRPDGKVSLCCNDALGKITLGDVTKEKLKTIWNGEKYNAYREQLLNCGRDKIMLCKNCDYVDLRKIVNIEQ